MSTKNPLDLLFVPFVHEGSKIEVVVTTDGQVKTSCTTAEGVCVAEFRVSPDVADTLADMYTKAAKMARAAVEPTAPPEPAKRP